MNSRLRSRLRAHPTLVKLVRQAREAGQVLRGEHPGLSRSRINLLEALPAFSPHSDGTYRQRASMVLDGVNSLPAALVQLASLGSVVRARELSLPEFVDELTYSTEVSGRLKQLLDMHGSDKASVHDYHLIYAALLHDPGSVRLILEIGMGTNNTDVISNMGALGRPGASLRAFRDFLPSADVHGADVDERILFHEDRISTHQVDQTSPASLAELAQTLPDGFDLIVDDGLHAPSANVQTLTFACQKIRVGGWIVIEDIDPHAREVWRLVGCILPPTEFESFLVACDAADVFLVRRIAP